MVRYFSIAFVKRFLNANAAHRTLSRLFPCSSRSLALPVGCSAARFTWLSIQLSSPPPGWSGDIALFPATSTALLLPHLHSVVPLCCSFQASPTIKLQTVLTDAICLCFRTHSWGLPPCRDCPLSPSCIHTMFIIPCKTYATCLHQFVRSPSTSRVAAVSLRDLETVPFGAFQLKQFQWRQFICASASSLLLKPNALHSYLSHLSFSCRLLPYHRVWCVFCAFSGDTSLGPEALPPTLHRSGSLGLQHCISLVDILELVCDWTEICDTLFHWFTYDT